MAHTITLSAEEMALIEQKRAEEKAKAEALLRSYDHYKENRIKSEENRIEQVIKEAEAKKQVYEGFFKSLTDVSPVFKLHCKKISQKRELDLFEIDENGYEIRNEYDEEGRPLRSLKPKETLKFDCYSYDIKLSYTGKVPEGHSYYVIAVPTYSKYSRRVNGYKMQVQGTGIHSWDGRGKMVNPKAVVNRVIGLAEEAFLKLQRKSEFELSQERIKKAFFEKYGHLEAEGVSIKAEIGKFTLTFKNEISFVISAYERSGEDGDIIFTRQTVTIPYDMNVDSIIGGLKNI
jgi:hypothetical protein